MMVSKEECIYALCDMYNRINGESYTYEKEFDILAKLIEEHFALMALFGLNKEYEKAEFDEEAFRKSYDKFHNEQHKKFEEANKERLESLRKKVQELQSEVPEFKGEIPIPRPYKIKQCECGMELDDEVK